MRILQKSTVILSILAIILLLAALFALPKNDTNGTIDLLRGYDWSHMAGGTQGEQGLTVTPQNRTIQTQDPESDIDNPPINLVGPSLEYRDDFIINISTDGLKNGDAIRFYSGVPIVYDEWRYEPASIEIMSQENSAMVSVWDGSSSTPASVKKYQLTAEPNKLTFEKTGNQLKLTADNRLVFVITSRPVFESGKLWFGFSAGSQSLSVKSLTVSYVAGSVKVSKGLTTKAQTSLRSGQIKFGAAIALHPLLTDEKYRQLALNNFNIWTPENEFKAQFIHPSQKTYSFNEADLLVDTALINKIAVHGHALVFGEANPEWMRQAPDDSKQAIMVDHVRTLMTHYKGRVSEWDVINEPLSDEDSDYRNGGDGLRRHLWYKAMGSDYISTALQAARSADPQARLYINDYGLEADGPRWQAMLKLIDKLQAQGVPLDGIGFEAHIHEASDRVDTKVLTRHFQELAKRGLNARISEIDVFGDDGTDAQADDYAKTLKVCLAIPNCVAYSTWGISDKYGSTTEYNSYPLEYGNDLLWDSGFKPKPAYEQVYKILNSTQEDL